MSDLIINKGTVQNNLQVAEGVDKQTFKRFIFEAQYIDLKGIVCEDFYNDLVNNYTDTKYQTLLAGSSYTYEDKNYSFEGLEKVLSYFAYGRFVPESPVLSTSFGMVRKDSNHSERVSTKHLESLGDKHNQRALQIFVDVKKYLDRNKETFPFWEASDCCKSEDINIELWG